MGYRIVYESSFQKHNQHPRSFPWAMTACFLFAFLFVVNHYWPQGRHILQRLLWPGDWEVFSKAMDVFVDQLRWGEPLSDAAAAFCRELYVY